MEERLGLGTITGAGWSSNEIRAVAGEAEAAGFDAIFATEVNNDVLATAQLMGTATERIQVGTWVANIFLRHPYVCAQGAAFIGEITGGRFVLGLGVSHQPVNGALDITMGDPPNAVVDYAATVKACLRGEGRPTHLPQHPAPYPVPVYVAALTSKTIRRAAEVADGIMPLFWSPDRVALSRKWLPGDATVDVTLGVPTYVGDDLDGLHEAARQNLALFTTFPFFQHLFRVSGFEEEAERMVGGAGGAALTDRLLDAICLIGPVGRCKERLSEYRAAGVGLPILMPPIGVDAARTVIEAFRR
jgi:alkanesulfonate monooxygenase SsuD/methylene tetrahydromethanopterin reductase-like flavin-dependent oxidoreductase (luciferase family)